MAITNCPKCWDTPCECGYQYKNYPKDYFVKLILGMISQNPYKEEILNELSKQIKTNK